MAQPITPVKGFQGSMTVNGQTAKFRGWDLDISNGVIKYATTGQSADSDGVYWMNSIAGLNEGTITFRGYWDQNATAAARWTGATFGLKPGTSAAGTVVILFTTGSTFSATVVVQSIRGSIDAESNKPSEFEAVLAIDGAVTYTVS
jgi:hypothetical protein